VHSILHCFDGSRTDVIVQQNLLLTQDVAKPFHRVIIVKVNDIVRVLDITDGTVLLSRMILSLREARFLSMYKRLRATVFFVDADAHAEMFIVFSSNQLDVLEDGHFDLFIAVCVEWLLCPFCRLEDGILCAFLLVLCDSAESPCLFDLALRNELQGAG